MISEPFLTEGFNPTPGRSKKSVHTVQKGDALQLIRKAEAKGAPRLAEQGHHILITLIFILTKNDGVVVYLLISVEVLVNETGSIDDVACRKRDVSTFAHRQII